MSGVQRGWGRPDALASRLKERIRIEKTVNTADGAGGVNREWVTHVQCFAEIVPSAREIREQVEAGALTERAVYRVTIRARGDVTRAMRVVWKGRVLNIRSVMQHDATTELVAEEGGAA